MERGNPRRNSVRPTAIRTEIRAGGAIRYEVGVKLIRFQKFELFLNKFRYCNMKTRLRWGSLKVRKLLEER
jgi:hypothetical protein